MKFRAAFAIFPAVLSLGQTRPAYAELLQGLAAMRGVDPDYDTANRELRPAAMAGDPEAQYSLGSAYDSMRPRSDLKEAAKWYRMAAEQGHIAAELRLAEMCRGGDGVGRDLAEAMKWFRRAANQGDASAEYELGAAHDDGVSNSSNEREAVTWYRKAALLGDAAAQYRLGHILAGGGTDAELTESLKWLRSAASSCDTLDEFHIMARKELDLLTILGRRGPDGHARQAAKCRTKADAGDVNCQLAIGLLYDQKYGYLTGMMYDLKNIMTYRLGDWDAAGSKGGPEPWYRAAAEQGNRSAQFYLARIFSSRDDAQAVGWYRKAAEQGDAQAQKELGDLYSRGWKQPGAGGQKVPADYAESVRWYKQAAEQGVTAAAMTLTHLYGTGQGVAKDADKVVLWLKVAATQGNLDAQIQLANTYFQQKKVSDFYTWMTKAAEAGSSEAQIQLGEVYWENSEFGEAVRWYRTVAENRNADTETVAAAYSKLGQLFYQGKGVARDYSLAYRWLHKPAMWGDAESEFYTGLLISEGKGTQKDPKQAIAWFRRALKHVSALTLVDFFSDDFLKWLAQHGECSAQDKLGQLYEHGWGVPQDYVEAHKWYNLAVANGKCVGTYDRDALAERMTPEQIAEAQKLASNWRPSSLASTAFSPRAGAPPVVSRSVPKAGADKTESAKQLFAIGTGFFVSKQGDILTNYHVVEGCRSVSTKVGGNEEVLALTGKDTGNDLAVLRSPVPAPAVASIATPGRVRLGQTIIVVGYPLRGILASGASVSTGVVSTLAGAQDDSRMLQITAPVQPGNSGGPLLDESGHVVGVVVGKVDALKIARVTGDIPENVSFAIKNSIAQNFLEANRVPYLTAPSIAKVDSSTISEQASQFTILVQCWK